MEFGEFLKKVKEINTASLHFDIWFRYSFDEGDHFGVAIFSDTDKNFMIKSIISYEEITPEKVERAWQLIKSLVKEVD